MPEPIIVTVSQLNNRIKNLLLEDSLLKKVTVKGEISNLTDHKSGHLYFTLKDEGAVLKCAMFKNQRFGLKCQLHNGDKVEATGRVDVYPPSGSYQLICSDIKPAGLGDLYAGFLALKQKLEEKGMFSEIYKKPLPAHVMRLGVITAQTGAAVRDIINISKRRNPYIQIILYPAIVQGDGAVPSLIKGLREIQKHNVDVIIIGRGGGSIEDLWAFNDEKLAEEIFHCEIPVISAVGHETDFTIADFVADLRAPTPSAAAELAVFEYEAFQKQISYYKDELADCILHVINEYRRNLTDYKRELQFRGPEMRVNHMRQRLDGYTDKLEAVIRERLRSERNKTVPLKNELNAVMHKCIIFNRNQILPLKNELISGMNEDILKAASRISPAKKDLAHVMQERLLHDKTRLRISCERLNALSPLMRIRDGYGYLSGENGKRIVSVDDAKTNKQIHVYLSDGRIDARVEAVSKEIFKTEGS